MPEPDKPINLGRVWKAATCVAEQFSPFGAESAGGLIEEGIAGVIAGIEVSGAGIAAGGAPGAVTVIPGVAEPGAGGTLVYVGMKQIVQSC